MANVPPGARYRWEEGRVLHETATVTGEDVLPGFISRISNLNYLNTSN